MSKKQSTKLKDMLNEHYILGELPSSKLMKMKWNPVTGETMNEEETNEVAPKMILVERPKLKDRSNLRQIELRQAYNQAPKLVASPSLSNEDKICKKI